jgi:hypothetical protein
MTRCKEFYERWEKDPNWCEKCPDSVRKINRYIDLIDAINIDEVPKKNTFVSLPEGAARPLLEIQDNILKEKVISSVRNALESGKNPVNGKFIKKFTETDIKKIIKDIEKDINHDRDAYMLFDNDVSYPRCIWIHYSDLRDFGIPKEYPHWGEKNEFLEIKKDNYHILNFGYRSFVNWCYKIKNREVVSDREQYKIAGKLLAINFPHLG